MNWIFSKLVLAAIILGILAFPAWGGQMKYEVISREGRVAVRQRDSGEVFLTDTRISMLPGKDRCLLQAGIACEDERALTEILENFCS